MAMNAFCDGVVRRDFLRAGALAGAGLSLADYLRLAEAGGVGPAKAKSAVFVYLAGGPSHMDTFDMKPLAPSEYRGEFQPIESSASGVRICEHFPKLARRAQHLAILNGVTHTLAAHELGTRYLSTGNRPMSTLEYPGYGSIVSKELAGDRRPVPPFVAIPDTPQTPGYLGVAWAPLATRGVPSAGKSFGVRGLVGSDSVTVTDVERRARLLRDVNQSLRRMELESELLDGLDRFREQAFQMISSPQARTAFDTGLESPQTAEPFGTHGFGMSCLLAARLIEAGVRFVTVTFGGWDTHNNNFAALKGNTTVTRGKVTGNLGLLPQLDDGLSALLDRLVSGGLLDSTLLCVTGEFGRTPKINDRAGRDHWPRAMSVLFAGGGVRGGQVLGASDERGQEPAEKGWSPDDVAATLLSGLGIDPTKEYHTPTGRPVMLVRDGAPIPGLLS